MAIRNIRRQATNPLAATGTPTASPIYVDSDDNILKMIPASSGTTEVQVIDASSTQTLSGKSINPNVILYAADGALTLVSQTAVITKAGSACLLSIAAPGVAGLRLVITSNSAFAHVITFTGATLWDGTTGANTTVTMTAFQGSSLTVVSASATIWLVESQNTLTSIA